MADPDFDPVDMLRALARHDVEFLVIGGLAAAAQGSPYPTRDLDITPARSRVNFGHLAAALRDLDAKLHVEGTAAPIEVALDEHSFPQGTTWAFLTREGLLDVALTPDGTYGYDDMKRNAVELAIADDLAVWFAHLRDVIRSKEAADREKDRRVLPELREVLSRLEP